MLPVFVPSCRCRWIWSNRWARTARTKKIIELWLHVGEAQPDKADSFLSPEHEGAVGRLQSAVSGGSGEGSHSGSGYVHTPTHTRKIIELPRWSSLQRWCLPVRESHQSHHFLNKEDFQFVSPHVKDTLKRDVHKSGDLTYFHTSCHVTPGSSTVWLISKVSSPHVENIYIPGRSA